MKKFIPFLSLAFLLAACSSQPENTEVRSLQAVQQSGASIDTAGLAQFQQWKSQNELNAATSEMEINEPVAAAPVKTITIIREVPAQQKTVVRRKAKAPTSQKETSSNTSEKTNTASSGSSTETAGAGTTSAEGDKPAEAEVAKKEGWSKAAKGGAIGAAGGAVIGAVINKKNPAVGAVIGGVLGGAVGYGVGRSKDKKDGRY